MKPFSLCVYLAPTSSSIYIYNLLTYVTRRKTLGRFTLITNFTHYILLRFGFNQKNFHSKTRERQREVEAHTN